MPQKNPMAKNSRSLRSQKEFIKPNETFTRREKENSKTQRKNVWRKHSISAELMEVENFKAAAKGFKFL